MTAPLLEVRGLTVEVPGRRPVALVQDVAVSVAPGELVCLVGESGSGKTVTGRSVLGLTRDAGLTVSGRIGFLGTDLAGLGRSQLRDLRGRELALIPQEPSSALDPLFPVGAQVAEAVRRARGGSRSSASSTAVELLERVHVPEPERRARQYPHELSGGLCQRVAVAMALAGQPRLIVADEPTSALDATVQLHLLELLDGVRRDSGTGMLLVTHDISVAARADRIVVLYAGRVVETGPATQVIAEPVHPYTAGLIASVPRLSAAHDPDRRLPSMPGSVPSPAHRPDGCVFRDRCPVAVTACTDEQPLQSRPDGRSSACWRSAELLGTAPLIGLWQREVTA